MDPEIDAAAAITDDGLHTSTAIDLLNGGKNVFTRWRLTVIAGRPPPVTIRHGSSNHD
jgi:hypothetical protein